MLGSAIAFRSLSDIMRDWWRNRDAWLGIILSTELPALTGDPDVDAMLIELYCRRNWDD